MNKKIQTKNGFTLVELLMVIGVFTILSSIVTINLLRPQIKSSVDKSLNILISDIKLQQAKAMIGDDLGTGNLENHGIYFSTNSYTLFKGSSYNASDPENVVIQLDGNTLFSANTLPSSQIVFSRLSGEVDNYASGQDSLTIEHSQDIVSVSLTINEYGALTIN